MYLVHGALIEAEILTSSSSMYLLNLGQFWVLPLCPHVCQHLSSDIEMFLYVSRTSKKYLLHWALIEAEIDAQFSPVLGTGTLPAGVSTPVKWSRNAPMCLRNLQKVFGTWGLNRSWDIDLPTPPYIYSIWPGLWTLALSSWVCQHLPSGLQMYLCVSGTYKINVVHGSLMETETLNSPPLNVFAQCCLGFGCWCSTHRCVNTSQVV